MLLTLVAIFFVDGMFVALAILAYAFSQPHLAGSLVPVALGSLILYVGCFAFSLGPIVWLLISEIFPLQSRGLGMSLCTLANWAADFVVSQFFLTMVERLGRSLTFAIYAALCLVTILVVARGVPETKKEMLEDIALGPKGPVRYEPAPLTDRAS